MKIGRIPIKACCASPRFAESQAHWTKSKANGKYCTPKGSLAVPILQFFENCSIKLQDWYTSGENQANKIASTFFVQAIYEGQQDTSPW